MHLVLFFFIKIIYVFKKLSLAFSSVQDFWLFYFNEKWRHTIYKDRKKIAILYYDYLLGCRT